MTTITAEALDGLHGRPADSIRAVLKRASRDCWTTVSRTSASELGRMEDWDCPSLGWGVYRITFDCGQYFAGLGLWSAWTEVDVTFRLDDGQERCHVGVTLSPYSYCASVSVRGRFAG